jgi:hypothetical protein
MESTIKLLDGRVWDKKELIEKMYDDAFYYGYLGKTAMSSSSLKKMLLSYDDYLEDLKKQAEEAKIPKAERPVKKALQLGRLVHVGILEPQKMDEYFHFVDTKIRRGDIWKQELAANQNKEVCLLKDKLWVEDMKDAVYSHSQASKLLSEGSPEVPEIDYVMGMPIRGKADWLRDDMIVDLKTTNNIDDFDYNCTMFGYDIQAYLYTQLFNKPRFVFIAVDKKTFKVEVKAASQEMIEEGKKKVSKAINNYIDGCF